MQEFTFPITRPHHISALDSALRNTLPADLIGVSTYGDDRPISVWLSDTANSAAETTVNAIVAAHDPVFLSADKLTIAADGTDTATITVHAPKVGAAPVTLMVEGTAVPVTLVDGVGAVQISGVDPADVIVTVQTPANRSTDQITISIG